MARKQITFISIISTILIYMALTGILQLVLVVSALAERCTRAVPIQKTPPKKMKILRRLPAACSNWDKTWAWLTKADCGTKYRLDYVTVPSRDVQYKMEYVCCDGDTECEAGGNHHSSGFDSTDEKFLAIVLGSTAAAVIIVIVVIAISLCTRKRRCLSARENGHSYDRAEAEEKDGGDINEEKCCQEDRTSEEECKVLEPVYAEIGDSTLPRYTDLFKEAVASSPEDPFKHASAPPINSKGNYGPRSTNGRSMPSGAATYTNSNLHGETRLPSSSDGPARDEDQYTRVSKQVNSLQHANENGEFTETKYYNVREKKKKKKKKSARAAMEKERACADNDLGENIHVGRKPRSTAPVSVEMMVKSSSTSASMGSGGHPKKETAMSHQKRRSAPPDSPELRIISGNTSRQGPNSGHIPANQTTMTSTFDHRTSDPRDFIPVCTVHQEPQTSTICSHPHSKFSNEGQKSKSSSKGQRRKADNVSKTRNHSDSAVMKSPPELDIPASRGGSQSYENIPHLNEFISNDAPKTASSNNRRKRGDKNHVSFQDEHPMHLNERKNVRLRDGLSTHVSAAQHPPGRDKEHAVIPTEEAESASPLLPHQVNSTTCEKVLVLSPILKDQRNHLLSSNPSSQSGISGDSVWTPSSGQGPHDYDTLQYSYDPSADEEHLYQKLEGLDPSSVPKC